MITYELLLLFFSLQKLNNIELFSWISDTSIHLAHEVPSSWTYRQSGWHFVCPAHITFLKTGRLQNKKKNRSESPQRKDKPSFIFDLVQHFVKQCSFQNKCSFPTVSPKRMAQVTTIKAVKLPKRSAIKCRIDVLGKSFKNVTIKKQKNCQPNCKTVPKLALHNREE